jgi:hypothetical protein
MALDEVQTMKRGKLALVGSGMATFALFASSPVRAADVNIGMPTGAQVGGAVDSATGVADAANGASKQAWRKR